MYRFFIRIHKKPRGLRTLRQLKTKPGIKKAPRLSNQVKPKHENKNTEKTRFGHSRLRLMAVSKPNQPFVTDKFPLNVVKIFVISIRPERWDAFRSRFGGWCDQSFLFKGTHGSNIRRKDWVRKKLISANSNLRKGQIGCFHSHVRLWKHIQALGLSKTLICEDDAAIYNNQDTWNYAKQIEEESKNLDYDLLFLGHHHRSPHKSSKVTAHITKAPDSIGLFSYVVTLAGVNKLIRLSKPPYAIPVDNLVSSFIATNKIKALRVNPSLCFVVKVKSDTKGIK